MSKYDAWHRFFKDLEGEQTRIDLDRLEASTGVDLPPPAREHAAWWSTAHGHAVWAKYGWRATPRLSTNEVVFRRVTAPVLSTRKTEHVAIAEALQSADLVLIGCVASKLPASAPAKDLYTSALWMKRRTYAEQSGGPWAILSAEHGLVQPDQVISPYDRYLEDESVEYRLSRVKVLGQISGREGLVLGVVGSGGWGVAC